MGAESRGLVGELALESDQATERGGQNDAQDELGFLERVGLPPDLLPASIETGMWTLSAFR